MLPCRAIGSTVTSPTLTEDWQVRWYNYHYINRREPIKLVIIRHPETNKIADTVGKPDAPSPRGHEQLSQIANVCRDENVSAVVHSTLPRAAVSAGFLAKTLSIPSIAQEGLQERDFGKWSTWDWPRISVELSKLSLESRYTFKPTGGESWEEMDVRLRAALIDISALNYESVAVMTHAGTMRVILNLLDMKSKSDTINFVPALGRCIVVDFDVSALK